MNQNMNPDQLAAQFDPAPLMQLMAQLGGSKATGTGDLAMAPPPVPAMMPPAAPYTGMVQGTSNVDTTQPMPGGAGMVTPGAAPFNPQMMAMMAAMMPKGLSPQLAPAGHLANPGAVNFSRPEAAAPTLAQLIGRR